MTSSECRTVSFLFATNSSFLYIYYFNTVYGSLTQFSFLAASLCTVCDCYGFLYFMVQFCLSGRIINGILSCIFLCFFNTNISLVVYSYTSGFSFILIALFLLDYRLDCRGFIYIDFQTRSDLVVAAMVANIKDSLLIFWLFSFNLGAFMWVNFNKCWWLLPWLTL